MISRAFARLSLPLALILMPLAAPGCGSERNGGEAPTSTLGTLDMPLVTTTDGHTYRLTGYLYVNGPSFQSFYLGDEEVIEASLPTGDYYAYLWYYSLSRLDDEGVYQPVDARLLSDYYQPFTIYNRTTTTVSYEFETDGAIVTIGSGNLDIRIDVTERPPVCTVLGDDCPEGTWCAPPELTARPLACVAAGSVEPGETCRTPQSCSANASCYDFGSGPECALLCTPELFDLPCPAGGTCRPEAAGYGVCAPDSAGGEGGAGGMHG